jgi:hypothetical protein
MCARQYDFYRLETRREEYGKQRIEKCSDGAYTHLFQMQQFTLFEAMVGVSRDAEGHVTIITLSVGSILTIVAFDLHSGLVDAKSGRRHYCGICSGSKSTRRSSSDYRCVRPRDC